MRSGSPVLVSTDDRGVLWHQLYQLIQVERQERRLSRPRLGRIRFPTLTGVYSVRCSSLRSSRSVSTLIHARCGRSRVGSSGLGTPGGGCAPAARLQSASYWSRVRLGCSSCSRRQCSRDVRGPMPHCWPETCWLTRHSLPARRDYWGAMGCRARTRLFWRLRGRPQGWLRLAFGRSQFFPVTFGCGFSNRVLAQPRSEH